MVEALIFITVEPNKIDKIGMDIKRLPNVKEVVAITGEFDIVARVEAKDFSELSKTLKEKILSIPGIVKSATSIITEKY
ncbi:MAG: Lrp/AsnC ligand binding domain-containing protein [archaeon YNP-LCB-003-016]|uniref:Lrp/AsnC family transcriptional regulator n=1 Tax=Candidatus Culexarchaeum yellowstonense TaxID=2928963 RepID=UPI0026F09EAA|nr:Lrp/AsnC ligand binding domain-containing protein [Candidatus Culexarchaeum yellowstonense]MCR6692583.1 Lrp/AsnC ligand binding domain-containing protein [Candidatus Culexarchaeum yellowstonense]MCR6693161.1 Lrp/AsnC ligand binding domain-containing protein [Candidatus Culexarchaeum yellowstonense]